MHSSGHASSCTCTAAVRTHQQLHEVAAISRNTLCLGSVRSIRVLSSCTLKKNHEEKGKDVVVAKYFPAPTANQASLTEHSYSKYLGESG